LFFEFKGEWTPRHVAKTVAAFANSSGGFLFFGAEATEGKLAAFPGLPGGKEWAREIANNIVGHVSPLPAWEVIEVPTPTGSGCVVAVRVDASRRTPHILCTSGVVYARSPGGTSDPVKDRASLDLLVERGRAGDAAVSERAKDLFERIPALEPGRGWHFTVVTVPLPYGSAFQRDLLTRQGYQGAQYHFRGGILVNGAIDGVEEEGVRLRFGQAKVGLYQDGALWLSFSLPTDFVPATPLARLVVDLLVTQRRLPTPAYETRVVFRLDTEVDMDLRERIDPPRGAVSPSPAPRRWKWMSDVSLGSNSAIAGVADEFRRRIWRATGAEEFEP
jgi:hypothetical protein